MNHEEKKTSRRRWYLLAALALVGVLALDQVAAAGPHHGGPPAGPFAFLHLFRKLDLTDQQELQLIKIRKDLHRQARDLHQQMDAPVGRAIDELAKPNPDPTKIHAAADQALQGVSKLVHSGIDQFLGLYATLSPQQREKFVAEAREIHAHRHGHPPAGAPGDDTPEP